MATSDALHDLLYELSDAVPGQIHGSLIASRDGLLITETLSDSEEAERIAAMVATTLGVSRRMARRLGAGVLNETAISATERRIQMYLIGSEGALAVVTAADANVALINIQARKVVKSAEPLLRDTNP
ncbi:hypothetical protein CRI93_07835 [Longimonas halophila]|uniref:Roadblock/LAMTOR2 domain-containing protein n=1 Tax=Longimonas halophila TaxID=1469170 RepID=A0A2H3NLV6_9BACT|nr:roadblock/LC7 domain-containing protein [Longimonas halophila]PEN07040.1 hypothetical protein CRI93_07835 [Longimonas halophila]